MSLKENMQMAHFNSVLCHILENQSKDKKRKKIKCINMYVFLLNEVADKMCL